MNINYQNKIVAFIDVLGFSELVYSENLKHIESYFNEISQEFSKVAKKNTFKYYLISDSIVISTNFTKSDLVLLIKSLSTLQVKLMVQGVIVRGAISSGKLYQNKLKSIIVGTGLINAFNLEKKAIYPRIIIDRNLIFNFFGGIESILTELKKRVAFYSSVPYVTDFVYLNYGKCFSLTNQTKQLNGVLQLFKNNYYNNGNIEKYEWLKSHILCGIQEQLDFLNAQENKTHREREKLKYIQRFYNEFSKI
jgi:hypothetical protein